LASPEEFTDVLSLCQLLPGPNIVNVAVCVGARYHGVGEPSPHSRVDDGAVLIVLALGALYTDTAVFRRFGAVPRDFRRGGGLVVAMGLKMATRRRLRRNGIVRLITFIGIALMRLPSSSSCLRRTSERRRGALEGEVSEEALRSFDGFLRSLADRGRRAITVLRDASQRRRGTRMDERRAVAELFALPSSAGRIFSWSA